MSDQKMTEFGKKNLGKIKLLLFAVGITLLLAALFENYWIMGGFVILGLGFVIYRRLPAWRKAIAKKRDNGR